VGFNLGDYILKLVLGFEDHPYPTRYDASSPLAKTVKRRRPKVMSPAQEAYGQGKTTKEVAADLEARYSIVETFWEMEEDTFIEVLEDAFADNIEEVMQMGQIPKTGGISDKETDKIEKKFMQSLQSRRFDGVIPGVPTTAAQRGVSHLYKQPYARRAPRPSFINTGMYQRSFRVWVEDLDEED
jgi:hypothetical protein